jgi:transcription termination factor NusB
MTLQHLTIQFLETVYILDNSKNVETIQSRIQFLETVVEKLIKLSSLPDYQYFTQIGIDDYKVRYLNKIPTEENIAGLSNPMLFNFQKYCINSVISGLQRHINDQLEEIQFFKSKVSKDKRLSKVIHAVLITRTFIEMKYSDSESYRNAISEIETIINKLKEYHETI